MGACYSDTQVASPMGQAPQPSPGVMLTENLDPSSIETKIRALREEERGRQEKKKKKGRR